MINVKNMIIYPVTVTKDRFSSPSHTKINLSKSLRLLDQAGGALNTTYTQSDVSMMLLGNYAKERFSLDRPLDLDTTNVQQLISDADIDAQCSGVFQEFSSAYQSKNTLSQVFELISSYSNILSDKTNVTKLLLKSSNAPKHRLTDLKSLYDTLRAEMWTWKLTESLLKDLVDNEIKMEEQQDEHLETMSAYTSDQMLMEQFFTKNSKVRQCQIVIDWLETMSSEDVLDSFYDRVEYFTESNGVMWENTLHLKKKAKNIKGLIKEMDPDAHLRNRGGLDPLDASDDDRLLRYVFALLRAGKLDEAQQLCIRCGQSWRAASLEGWRLNHDPNFDQDRNDDTGQEASVVGNQNRDIWKSMCWSMAQEDLIPTYEKAIYACLSGNLDCLLPVCESWHDGLWAYLKVIVDVELEQHIRLRNTSERKLIDLPATYWSKAISLQQMFNELDANNKTSIKHESQAFFNKIVRHLIVQDYDGILKVMNEQQENQSVSPHMLRFMTHFVLLLRTVDRVSVDESVVAIVDRYIQFLIYDEQPELVAIYCSVLPSQNQVLTYAFFLEENESRKRCLELGKNAGLDITMITKVVVGNAYSRLMELLDANTPAPQDKMDDAVSSLDWLLFNQDQILDALHHATAFMRVFLVMNQLEQVLAIYHKLPSDCVSKAMSVFKTNTGNDELSAADSNCVKEYICFKVYLDAQASFDDWFKHFHQAPKKPEKVNSAHFTDSVAHEQHLKQFEQERKRWQNALEATTKVTIEQLKAVLLFAGGWMVDENAESSGKTRTEQLIRLRQLCIPSAVALLHEILHSTEQYSEAVRIANLVTSEDHMLYQAFSKSEIQKLMLNIQESAKKLLDSNLDAVGFARAK